MGGLLHVDNQSGTGREIRLTDAWQAGTKQTEVARTTAQKTVLPLLAVNILSRSVLRLHLGLLLVGHWEMLCKTVVWNSRRPQEKLERENLF
jgi:hypothetical protein